MATSFPPPVLIRDAIVLTMDNAIGDFWSADVLIAEGAIQSVGTNLPVPASSEIIDGRGKIVIPGLVNCHMHTWQTSLRGLTSNWTLFEYFRWVHAGLATAFEPNDIRIATLAGALGQLNAGTTTLGDWCHNNPTPAHTDAAISALRESGIRAVFLHGSPKPDPKPGQPHFSTIPHPRGEIERLLGGPLGEPASLVGLGMAILGPHYSTLDVARTDFRLAREKGLVVSMHYGGGPPVSPGGWDALEAEGLIGPGTDIVHGNDLTDVQLQRFAQAGVTFTVAPENEMTQGHGWPIIGRVLTAGGQPSLGVDIESLVSADMFTVARMGLAAVRGMAHAQAREAGEPIPAASAATTRQALGWITRQGAHALGLDARIGSITPGKQADLVVLDATGWGMWPVHDPYSTVVMQAGIASVEHVLVAGRFRKRNFRVLVENGRGIRAALAASGERIVQQLGIPTQMAQ